MLPACTYAPKHFGAGTQLGGFRVQGERLNRPGLDLAGLRLRVEGLEGLGYRVGFWVTFSEFRDLGQRTRGSGLKSLGLKASGFQGCHCLLACEVISASSGGRQRR